MSAKAHAPVSVVLRSLLHKAPADEVTLEWLLAELRERSFGLVLLAMAVVALIPGGSTVMGVLLIHPALQLIAGRERPSLPRALAARRIAVAPLATGIRRAAAVLERLERFTRPRWRLSELTAGRIVGGVVLVLAPTLIWPFPFSHVVPAVVIALLALAYLEKDGLLLWIAVAAAAVSVAMTAATVWASIATTNFLLPLLGLTRG